MADGSAAAGGGVGSAAARPGSGSTAPRDAQTVEAILLAMGVEEHDERVVPQLLELLYRYVSAVLGDARIYSEHADKTEIDLDDVKLAILTRVDSSFTQPPTREVAMRLARETNSVPLPAVDLGPGLALPRPELQLTAQNIRIKIPEKVSSLPTSAPSLAAPSPSLPAHNPSLPVQSPSLAAQAPSLPLGRL